MPKHAGVHVALSVGLRVIFNQLAELSKSVCVSNSQFSSGIELSDKRHCKDE